MPTYLVTDSAGLISAAYSGPASGAPTGAVSVPASIYAQLPHDIAGWSYVTDALVAPVAPAPTLAQQAAAAIAAGLTITLSGTMTLAATLFPTDPTTTAKIGAVVTAINADGTFPGGATTFPMKDATGAWHTFTASQYKAVAGGIAAYVAALNLIIDGNPLGATSLPANAVALTV